MTTALERPIHARGPWRGGSKVARPAAAPILVSVALLAVLLPALRASAAVTLAIAPRNISPNGDSVKDVTAIEVVLDDAASLTVEARNASAVVVRRLVVAEMRAAGTHTISWDGDGDTGARVPDGRYTIVATARSSSDIETTSTGHVVIDTRRPSVAWRDLAPEPLRSDGKVIFTVRTTDAAERLGMRIKLYDGRRRFISSVSAGEFEPGYRGLAWRPRSAKGNPLRPGLYHVRISARDPAGNKANSARKAFRIHRPVDARVYTRLENAGRRVVLTFDDCYRAADWSRILTILRERKVRAAFFCSGQPVRAYRELTERTLRDGHAIGSHTWSHRNLTSLSQAGAEEQIAGDHRSYWRYGRTTSVPYFRPPYGAYNRTVLRAAGALGYSRVMMWDVDPQDWRGAPAGTIKNRVVSRARPGSIILLHTLPNTARALPGIIWRLKHERNLQPVGLDELFDARR